MNKKEDNQVSSTTCQGETDYESSSSSWITTTDDDSSIECIDEAAGTSDWFRDDQGVPTNGAAFNTKGNPNDGNTAVLGLTRPVRSVSTQTESADLARDTQGVFNPYLERGTTSRVYNSRGIHIASGLDLCDCFVKECPGCQLSCQKCGSCKCGSECRRNRKY